MTKPLSVQEIISDLKERYPANNRLVLSFGDCIIETLTNSLTLKNTLEEYFKDFVVSEGEARISVIALEADIQDLNLEYKIKQPDPGKTKIKEEYVDFEDGRVVKKRLTGMIFAFGRGVNVGVGPSIENSNQIINFINNRYIEFLLNEKYLLAHAAGVIWQGKGISMAGFSGMGKSTLALNMMSRGATFVSNDRLLFREKDGGLEMAGVPKLPRINPGTVMNNPSLKNVMPESDWKKFQKLPAGELWDLEHKYDVFIDQCFGENKFVLSSQMDVVVMLNWQRNSAKVEVRQVDFDQRRDLLTAFMKSPGLFYEPESLNVDSDLSEQVYVGELKKVPVLEITGGVDFDQASCEVANFLGIQSAVAAL